MSLEFVGLRRRYGEVVALDDLSFAVPPGQVFGFLGPNGAGKTTAMRAVFGLVNLYGGSVRWQGGAIGLEERRRFGYMPEERGLYPGMQIQRQLEYLCEPTATARPTPAARRRTGSSASGSPSAPSTSSSRCRSATSNGSSSPRR